jgi:effector-binding domain-containing protein
LSKAKPAGRGKDMVKHAGRLQNHTDGGHRRKWPPVKENAMSFGALRTVIAGATLAVFISPATPSSAQTPAKPPSTPTQIAPPATPPHPGDVFGEDATLTAKTIVYVKGTGTWDKAFEIIRGSLKKIDGYLDKEGIKADGMAMTIFTATDDTGFDYEAAVPIAAPPKNPPHGDLAVGQSPEGQALKFVHRGSYEDLDNTYEAITNYLDDKRLEAKDMFIEEYVTDPATADAKMLVVNVYVLIKPGQSSPG